MKKQKQQQGQRQRQHQKLSKRTIIILCSSISFAAIGLVIFFHLSSIESTNARNSNLMLFTDQDFTTEKSITAPVIAQRPAANQNTIFVKQAKPISHPVQTSVTH